MDKFLALLCFFFYWIDICEMFATSMEYVAIPQQYKEKEERLILEKEALQKAKKMVAKNLKNIEMNDSGLPIINETIESLAIKDIIKDLPVKLEEDQLTSEEAEQLNYKKEINT